MLKFTSIAFLLLFSVSSAMAAAGKAMPGFGLGAGNICQAAIEIAEVRNEIPRELLQALALNESGKWNEKTKSLIAWPWTLTANGEGHYYEDYDETLAAIKKFQKKGIRNIDVGCMQINLEYHGKNFNSLDEVLDPVNNVAYGASFLTYLRQREHSWTRAVKFYHSANRNHHNRYSKKVIKTWQKLRHAKVVAKKTKSATTKRSKLNKVITNY